MPKIITGHEVEISELERQEKTFARRAITLKLSGQLIAEQAQVLLMYATGKLNDEIRDIFGEIVTVQDQIDYANKAINAECERVRATLNRTDWVD